MVGNKTGNITPNSFSNFGELLRYLRHRAAITQRELAIQVGYHYSYLSRIERNERFPEANMILARFVPALQVEGEPEWAARLVELAALGRGEPETTITAAPPERLPIPAPATPPAPPPPDLPIPLTSLLGREHEVAILGQLLANPQIRLLTLTGPPGIGKTRLALQTAAEAASQFAEGTLFVDLSGVRDPLHLAPALLQALHLPETAEHMAEQALWEALHGRQQLLILDNFEQIIPSAPVVSRLLRHAPQLKVLVTSREILRLNGENEFAVPPLPIETELGAPAVRLFAQRAQAAQPSWQLTAANQPAVAELCRRLDGLPLAIELAAARIKLFSPEAMVARLDKRLGWLTGGKRDDHDWRQTMRGAIEWSYQLLTAEEKRLWEALSVFLGGGTLAAVEQVCGGDLETVMALAEKNLLTLRPASTAEEELRFGWLESLRELAAERLANTAEATAVHQRHAHTYTHLVEQWMQAMFGAKQVDSIRHMREEEGNLLAALRWLSSAAPQENNAVWLVRLVLALERYWLFNGRISEARRWFAQVQAHLPLLPAVEQWRFLNRAGNFAQMQHAYAEAQPLHELALAGAQAAGDDEFVAHTLHHLGNLAGRQGAYEQAQAYLEPCLAIYRQNPTLYANFAPAVLNNLAIVYRRMGYLEGAQQLWEESLALKRARQDAVGTATTLANLGQLALLQRDVAQAMGWQVEGLRLRYDLNDWPGVVNSVGHMAEIATVQERYTLAARLYAAVMAYRTAMNLPFTADGQADYQATWGLLAEQLGVERLAQEQQAGERLTIQQAAVMALEAIAYRDRV
jgi:predicted ATPase/transcriptional regulator with XRE-family HTH domain